MDGNKQKDYNTQDTRQDNRQETTNGDNSLRNFENFSRKFNQCRSDLGNLNSYLTNIKDDLSQTIADVNWLKEELINSQKDNSFKQKEISSLKKELEKSQNEQNEYREQIKDLKSEIQNYVAKLQAKEKEINDCKAEIAKNEEYVNRIKNKIKSLTQVTDIVADKDNNSEQKPEAKVEPKAKSENKPEERRNRKEDRRSGNSAMRLKHVVVDSSFPSRPIVVIKPDGNYRNYESKEGILKFFRRHVQLSTERERFNKMQSAKQVIFVDFSDKRLNNVSDFPVKKAK